MSTPLYKSLNKNGVSTYAFPSAAEDFGMNFQNENYQLFFSHFVLLNIPEQRLTEPIRLNFDDNDNFPRAQNLIQKPEDSTFANKLIESLRNYVANKDETLRGSKNSPNTYYYDQNIIKTPTERIFFNWLKKLGIIQFEVADGPKEVTNGSTASVDYGKDWTQNIPAEYDDSEGILNKNNRNNVKYFKEGYQFETFQKEREVQPKNIMVSTSNTLLINLLNGELYIQVDEPSNKQQVFKVNDYITIKGEIYDIHKQGHPNFQPLPESALLLGYTGNEKLFKIKRLVLPTNSNERLQLIIDVPEGRTDVAYNVNYCKTSDPLNCQIYYDKVVKYVGEISEQNNVEVANKNISEIVAYVPEQSGQTPLVLFRTFADKNFRPGISFPFLPAQQEQREIQGAEFPENGLVTNPNDYPGTYQAHFDRADSSGGKQQYTTSSGDFNKRTGDFFGVNFYDRAGNQIAQPGNEFYEVKFDAAYLDGISIDFNTQRYTPMSVYSNDIKTFEEFNASPQNGQPPKDFEFNAVLWYYDVYDKNTEQKSTNLYGISFIDHPDNNCNPDINAIPSFKKYAPNDSQDGVSYMLSLNLNYNIINEQLIQKYDPNSGHNLRDYYSFNEAIQKLTEFNDLFVQIIEAQNEIKTDIYNIKSLVYTETQLETINQKMDYLESLLNLYRTIQIKDSDSIISNLDVSTSPPQLTLHNVNKFQTSQFTIKTDILYDKVFSVVNDYSLNIPNGGNFLVDVINNDAYSSTLSSSLTITIDKDFKIGQYGKFIITPNSAYENKKLSIRIQNPSQNPQDVNSNQYYYFIKDIDLPVDYNQNYLVSNGDFSTNNQNNYGIIKRLTDISNIEQPDMHSIWSNLTPENEIIIVLNDYHGYLSNGDIINLTLEFSDIQNNKRENYNLSAQLPIKSIVHNTFNINKGELDILLNINPKTTDIYEKDLYSYTSDGTTKYSVFPIGSTALIFDYENNTEFERLINTIKQYTYLNNNNVRIKINPDKYRLDAMGNVKFTTSQNQSEYYRNFQHKQPKISFNFGQEIDITKTDNIDFVNSFILDVKQVKNIKKSLDI